MSKTMKAALFALPFAAMVSGVGIAAAAGGGDAAPARNEVQVAVRNDGTVQRQMQQIQLRQQSRPAQPAQPAQTATNVPVQSRDHDGTCDGSCDGTADRLQTQDRIHSATCTPNGTPTGTGQQHHGGR